MGRDKEGDFPAGGAGGVPLFCLRMREVPGTLRAERVPFGSTRWQVVRESARGEGVSPEAAQAALAALCRQYWPPLYSFARRRGYNSPDAQDLTQEFFAHLLENRLYARADPTKGKFRSFLLTLFKRFLSDASKRKGSQKRGGGLEFVPFSPELAAEETLCLHALSAHGALDEEHFFDRHWAETLVGAALAALREEYASESRAELFESLQPFLIGGEGLPSQAEAASRLEMPAVTLRSHLARLRARYRETLRAEAARTAGREEDIDEELRYLCRVLLQG